jgi:hypothetical protein
LKHLWWTWHNGEPLYTDRIWGVPVASTFWIISSTFALSLTLKSIIHRFSVERRSFISIFLLAVIGGPFATVVVMQLPFVLIYHPIVTFAKYHASLALYVTRVLCLLIVAPSLLRFSLAGLYPDFLFRSGPSQVIFQMVVVFVPSMLAIAYFFAGDTANIVRTSFGQPFGLDCNATEPSFWGAFQRQMYVCPSRISPERDQYDLHCVDQTDQLPQMGSTWYTVCGTPEQEGWMLSVGLLGVSLYFLACACEFRHHALKGKQKFQ